MIASIGTCKNETGSSGWWYRPPEYRYRPEKKASVVAKPVVPPGSTGVIIYGPPSTSKLRDALIAAIKKFDRGEAIPIAEVRKRLEATLVDVGLKFNWRTQRNTVNRARDAAG